MHQLQVKRQVQLTWATIHCALAVLKCHHFFSDLKLLLSFVFYKAMFLVGNSKDKQTIISNVMP